jgi:hypothetical protein
LNKIIRIKEVWRDTKKSTNKESTETRPVETSLLCLHTGTNDSRDPDQITGLASEKACRARIKKIERDSAPRGVRIAWATAFGPNGKEVKVHDGVPYR